MLRPSGVRLAGVGLVLLLGLPSCGGKVTGECLIEVDCAPGFGCVLGSCVARPGNTPTVWSLEVTPDPASPYALRELPEVPLSAALTTVVVDSQTSLAMVLERGGGDPDGAAASVHATLSVASTLAGRRPLQFEADAASPGLANPYLANLAVPSALLGREGELWVTPRPPLNRQLGPWLFDLQIAARQMFTLSVPAETLELGGTLLSSEGLPVADYEARVVIGARLVSNLARTDSAGHFLLRVQRAAAAQSPDPLRVEIAPADPALRRSGLRVVVAPGMTDLRELRLPPDGPARSVAVAVVDPAGQPVAGATLRLQGLVPGGRGGEGFYARSGQTGRDGQVTLPLLATAGPAGDPGYLVEVVPPGGAAVGVACQAGWAPGDGAGGPPLVLPARVPLEGRVWRADGRPAPGVRVRASRQGDLLARGCGPELELSLPPVETSSAGDGRFRLLLDPGDYRFEYEPAADAALPLAAEENVAVLGPLGRDVNLPLAVLVEGRVTSPGATTAPLPDAVVRAFAPGSGQLRGLATTGKDGRFRLILPQATPASRP